MSGKLKSSSGLLLIYILIGLLLSFVELKVLGGQKSVVYVSNTSFFVFASFLFLPVPQIINFLNPGFQKIFQLIISYLILTLMIILGAHLGSRGLSFLLTGEHIPFINESFYLKILVSVPAFIGTLIYFYSTYYYRAFREQIMAEADWKAQKNEVELNLLKARLNPHFLFNSLNSIAALSITENKKMPEYLGKLSAFLRTILSKRTEKIVYLEDELEQIRRYISLEKLRFGDRLNWVEDLQYRKKEVRIPVFIFQPLIENAIKHGVNESSKPILITFKGRVSEGMFKAEIKNDVGEMPGHKKGTGWGLENVKKQLNLIYGRKDLMNISKSDGKFIVNLYFPLDEQF